MKILFLSHYFPPETNAPASRVFDHCRAWVAAGHEVTVITCAPNHPYGHLYEGYQNQWHEESMEGIRVLRVKTYVTANKGFFKRTISHISFMLASLRATLKLDQHDLVVTTSPQFFNGLAGYFVSLLKRIPWVLEIRDLWPDSILAVGAIKNKLIINTLFWLERFSYKACDRLVVVTESFRHHIIGKGIASDKISVIKNGVDLSLFNPNANIDELDYAAAFDAQVLAQLKSKFVVAYVGTHGMAHGLQTLMHAAARLAHIDDIHFLMVGDGAEKERLLALKETLNLNNVTMLDQKPKTMMPALWALTDVSLVHLKRDDVFKSVIPSKIFESMAMKKPILLGVEGESAQLLLTAQAGLTFQPEDDQQLATQILTLHENAELCHQLGLNGAEFVREHFDRVRLAYTYEQLLLGTLARSKSKVYVQLPAVNTWDGY